MMLSTTRYLRCKTAATMLLALLFGAFGCPAAASESSVGIAGSDENITVKNVWVDVPISQIFRDISIESNVIIATCPHVSDALVSLDAGQGKPLDECLKELIAGQGLFIYQKNKRFYLVVCGDPECPSTVETVTSDRIYLKYITAKHLRGSLPKSLQQYVTSGDRDTEVLVYAVPGITKHITEIVDKLDIPQEQVMLEVLVVDLWDSNSDEFGLDWSILGPHTAFSMADGVGGFTGTASYASVAASNLTQLGLTLRALVSEKRASIRSRPRVATINGEKATVDISLDEYFTIATDLYGTSLRTELEVIKSGVLLEMTPHIGDDGNITIDVLTEVSDVASRKNSSGGGTSANSDLPVIRRRKADTLVRVKEGDAIVIGGLIETQETTDHRRVPLAGDIPVIGGLFKSKEDLTTKKEVMIFITPQIMREGQIVASDRHTLINEAEEVSKLRTVTPDKRYAEENKRAAEDEVKSLNEIVNMLDNQKQSSDISHEINAAKLSGDVNPKEIDDERKILEDVIALLDVKDEQTYPVTATPENSDKASLGVIGK
ncbi:MAG TPA: hypothetical protein DDW84_02955 [Phycisphaerales bacterium]|nr:hypothetical protein [Phycisphaerales bacterium]HBR20196.1 hypothetical protein [Phycisphaerales bacterium]